MSTLTREEQALGAANTREALGFSRRDFLKAAAAAPALGAFYFAYGSFAGKDPVRAVIIGTGDEGCQAMIRDHNRDYVNYIGYCDIRPTQLKRGRTEFLNHKQYTPQDVDKLKVYDNYKKVLEDPEVEMVVIALPLWLHAPVAIDAMKAGKHVFTEKLMAWTVGQCKEMCQVARDTNRLLAVGHQRHYSTLYDNANYLINEGFLGDVCHIRALWHRNNGQPIIQRKGAKLVINDNGGPRWEGDGELEYEADGTPKFVKDEKGNILYWDSWARQIPEADRNAPWKENGYQSLHELIAWRLYDRTGAGLMAELGSHQLDACSIFLGKQHPIACEGSGGKYYYKDDRQVDDHVFMTYEFPGKKDPKDRIVVTYSSICTNAFEDYGETVMGTLGTMIVRKEEEILLFKEPDRNRPNQKPAKETQISVAAAPGGKPVMETSASFNGGTAQSSWGGGGAGKPSRGYREELEHFAWCIREGDKNNYHAESADITLKPRCRGEVALADAVIALTSNIAMRKKLRVDFKPEWFEWNNPATPEKDLA